MFVKFVFIFFLAILNRLHYFFPGLTPGTALRAVGSGIFDVLSKYRFNSNFKLFKSSEYFVIILQSVQGYSHLNGRLAG